MLSLRSSPVGLAFSSHTSCTTPSRSFMWNLVRFVFCCGLYSTGMSVTNVPLTLYSVPGSANATAKPTERLVLVMDATNVPIKPATSSIKTMWVRFMGEVRFLGSRCGLGFCEPDSKGQVPHR